VSDTPSGPFPKSAHLLRHSDFVRVYQQGRRHFSANMTFFYLQNEGEGSAQQAIDSLALGEAARRYSRIRIGFTVPKALGGAVERNRMRRRTREAVRFHLALFQNMDAAVDVVINPKKSLLTADFAQISHEVERGFTVIRRAAAQTKQPGAGESKPSGAMESKRSGTIETKRSGAIETQRGAVRGGKLAARREAPQR
jgi:ribonuclease P protein component